MPRCDPRVSGKELVAALQRMGWTRISSSGSHIKLRGPNGGVVIVPVHGARTLPLGTLKSILKQIEVSAEEIEEFL